MPANGQNLQHHRISTAQSYDSSIEAKAGTQMKLKLLWIGRARGPSAASFPSGATYNVVPSCPQGRQRSQTHQQNSPIANHDGTARRFCSGYRMAPMTASPVIARTALSGKEWRVLILLVISALINYIDRTTLSVAATDIQLELHLTNTQVGALQSAFFASYALCQLSFVAGWVVGRFHVGWVLACGFFLWSGATAITGAATVFAMILALRLLLGVGESVSYPSYSRILASEYPEHHRGFANALIDSGTKVGPALGILVGGLLVSQVGWRVFFVVLGGASLLWLVPWVAWRPAGGDGASSSSSSAGPACCGSFRGSHGCRAGRTWRRAKMHPRFLPSARF